MILPHLGGQARTKAPPAFARKHSSAGTWNERLILDLVRRAGVTTRAELTRQTQLTVQSVSRLVEGLAARDLLRFGEREHARGLGNTGVTVALNPQAAYSLGASIMTDAISVAIMDFAGGITDVRFRAVDAAASDIIQQVCDLASEALAAHLPPRAPLLGAGLAMTGYFVGDGRVNPPEPLDAVALIDLRSIFANRLGIDVLVENDGTAAAIAESFLGIGQRHRSFAYIHFAHGVGGGLILDGRALRGVNGNAGEVAGILPETEFENRPRLALLLDLVRRHGVAVATITDMVDRFDLQWPGVAEWIDRTIAPLNLILSSLSSVLDPEAIVLGGRLPTVLGEMLIQRCRYFDVPRRDTPRSQPLLLCAEVGPDPAVLGAAALPFKEHLFV